jgi:spore germination cell wall hydrolase CwlJ-like protein
MSIWRVPTPDTGLPPKLWPDLIVLTSTVLGEAEGEDRSGKRAVAAVVRNRANDAQDRWPKRIADVCLQPAQFSCWQAPNRLKAMTKPKVHSTEAVWTDCFLAAVEALYGYEPDFTGAANHYLNEKLLPKLPSWARADAITVRIGQHTFYCL